MNQHGNDIGQGIAVTPLYVTQVVCALFLCTGCNLITLREIENGIADTGVGAMSVQRGGDEGSP